MKKILFIGMTDNYGGVETFIMNIFRKLNGSQFQFDFIKENPNKKIAYEDEIIKNGGHIYCVPVANGGVLKYIKRKQLANQFFKKHHDYDIVHLNCVSVISIYWLKSAYSFGIKKLIVHSHIDRDFAKFSKLKSICFKLWGNHDKKYISKHKNIVKLAASSKAGKYMFNSNDFKVIDNGIEVDKYKYSLSIKKSVRKELNIADNYNIIMTVAKIDYQKNYTKVVNVFNKIHDDDKNTKLVIIGNKSKEYNKILNMVKSYGLTNSVLFLGVRKDVNKLLSAADLILMPSIIEAFPFALVESQTAGVPGLVSEGVIPAEENITGKLTYVSLDKSDGFWKDKAINILNDAMNERDKINMYNIVKNSEFNLDKSINDVKNIYSSLV